MQPPVWAHVPVLVNEQRKKLSKRRDKVALEGYRDEGYLADAMVNYLMTLGWAPKGDTEIVPWAQIEADFRLEDVTHSPAFFDIKKLTAFNGEYIRAMPVEEFVAACEPWFAQWRDAHPRRRRGSTSVWQTMAPLVQTRIGVLAEAPGYVDFLLLPEPDFDEGSVAKAVATPQAREVLADVIAAYESVAVGPRVDEDVLRRHRRGAGAEAGQGAGADAGARSPVAPSARRCTSRSSCSVATRRCAGCARSWMVRCRRERSVVRHGGDR